MKKIKYKKNSLFGALIKKSNEVSKKESVTNIKNNLSEASKKVEGVNSFLDQMLRKNLPKD